MSDQAPANTSDVGQKRPVPVPEPAVRRLSLYLRQLEAFQASGLLTVSSKQLADPLGFTDAQVRKDLGYFGQFGKPGKGYSVTSMIATIRKILGTDRIWNAILVGAGNLGNALAGYRGFARKGFRIVAVLDKDPGKVGQSLDADPTLVVQPMEQLPDIIREKNARLAVLAVPAEAAQQVAEQLTRAGIFGVLNFAPVTLALPREVSVNDIDLAGELEQLAFHIGSTVKM